MILKASQRGGARQLAAHLMHDENEHIDVHEVRGFMSDDLKAALQEAYAVSRGTKAKKYLFSLSLNPPANENVPTEIFEDAIKRAEQKLGLKDQPRAIVFHEKEGRRHAHCVWSRIDGEQMKAIKLPYYKKRLNSVAKDLFLEHGWTLPKGFISPQLRDPRNFKLAEWQQAKRHKLDPREIKQQLQQCWKASDDRKGFTAALKASGFVLAQGDRRGFVAVDWRSEVYPLRQALKLKAKDFRDKLGDHSNLPTASETKKKLVGVRSEIHQRLERELHLQHRLALQPLQKQRRALLTQHKKTRQSLKDQHAEREQNEHAQRLAKLRTVFSSPNELLSMPNKAMMLSAPSQSPWSRMLW